MKLTKRFLAIIMAAVMVVGISVVVYAASATYSTTGYDNDTSDLLAELDLTESDGETDVEITED